MSSFIIATVISRLLSPLCFLYRRGVVLDGCVDCPLIVMLPSLLISSSSVVKAVLVDFLVGFLANRLVILVPLVIVYLKLYSTTCGLQMKTIAGNLNIYSHAPECVMMRIRGI